MVRFVCLVALVACGKAAPDWAEVSPLCALARQHVADNMTAILEEATEGRRPGYRGQVRECVDELSADGVGAVGVSVIYDDGRGQLSLDFDPVLIVDVAVKQYDQGWRVEGWEIASEVDTGI